ncbi:Serine/threonine-protein kinase PknB [Planctomycetes bacterium Pla163]|uniref:Serine/threonine-protein kinase PknB n=1 Tax=Rohdeia mirabilis TaxID=2528008 RepID=A0A518CV43_9BACT|nr:Serine/threonine-protein kinase PknB [Planctomycetes bacterium Pla163]
MNERDPHDSESATLPSQPDARPQESAGDRIDRYTLIEQIGSGGFGSVWRARQTEPVRRDVALKILKLGMDTEEVVRRFAAERQALALMDHPFIAKVHDGGATAAGRPYFVMEFVDGVPITKYCDDERLGVRERLELFTKVCAALQHAHAKGVVHRDVKPSNVLVTSTESGPEPKVIDFGIAKALEADLSEHTLVTGELQMIGTPEYMAPEQTGVDVGGIDTRVDVYSLGVLLYELLTGAQPFDLRGALLDLGFHEMLRRIREAEPTRPSTRIASAGDSGIFVASMRRVGPMQLQSELRGDLDWIVLKALEKDRERRYETPAALAQDVRNHLDHRPVVAMPPSRAYLVSKFVRRNRIQVIGALALFGVLVVGVIGTGWGLAWALDEQDRAERAAESVGEAKDAALALVDELELARDEAEQQRDRYQREYLRALEAKFLITDMFQAVDPISVDGADTSLLRRVLERAERSIVEREARDPWVDVELRSVFAATYANFGDHERAREILETAIADFAPHAEERDATLLDLRIELASAMVLGGAYEDAEELLARILPEVVASGGGESRAMMRTLELRAELAARTGRMRAALADGGRALELHRSVYGDTSSRTAVAMGRLSGWYELDGRLERAEELATESHAIFARNLKSDPIWAFEALERLVLIRARLGHFAANLPLADAYVDEAERLFGADRPATLRARAVLATYYAEVGSHVPAMQFQSDVVDGFARIYGIDAAPTVAARERLAALVEAAEAWIDGADASGR